MPQPNQPGALVYLLGLLTVVFLAGSSIAFLIVLFGSLLRIAFK